MALSFDRRLLPILYYYYNYKLPLLHVVLLTPFLEYKNETKGESTTGRKRMEEDQMTEWIGVYIDRQLDLNRWSIVYNC